MLAQKTNVCVGKMQKIFVVWLHKKIIAQIINIHTSGQNILLCFYNLTLETSLFFVQEVLFFDRIFSIFLVF